MKKTMKLLSILLSMAVMMCCMPLCVLAEEETTYLSPTNGYFWLEAENSTSKVAYYSHQLTADSDKFSGGKALGIYSGAVPGDRGHYIDFYIDVPATEEYDLWIFGSKLGDAWASAAKIKIDGVGVTNPTNVCESAITSGSDMNGMRIGWNRTTAMISAGEHTLTYYIDTKCTQGYYVSIFDVLCLVPKSYNYDPSAGYGATVAAPTGPAYVTPTNGYFRLEGEAGAHNTYFSHNLTADSAKFSGGAAQGVYSGTDTTHYIDFYINVPTAEEYDFWIFGSKIGNAWASTVKIKVDDTSVTNPTNVCESATTTGTDMSGMPIGWNKTTAMVPAGEHRLRYYIDTKCQQGYYVSILDVIYLVPKAYNYDPSASTGATAAAPTGPAYITPTKGYFWLEGEAGTHNSYFNHNLTADSAKFSGGAAQGVYSGVDTTHYIDFYIDVPSSREYDFWIFGSKIGDNWASTVKLKIDDTAITTPTNICESALTSGSVMNGIRIGWNKTTATISAGEHRLRYYIDTKCTQGYYVSILDVICLVPSSYDYDPSASYGATAAKPYNEFDVVSVTKSGTVAAGSTVSATADVVYNGSSASENAVFIIAVFQGDDRFVDASYETKAVTDSGTKFTASVTIPADYSGDLTGAYVKALLWHDLVDIIPITDPLK